MPGVIVSKDVSTRHSQQRALHNHAIAEPFGDDREHDETAYHDGVMFLLFLSMLLIFGRGEMLPSAS